MAVGAFGRFHVFDTPKREIVFVNGDEREICVYINYSCWSGVWYLGTVCREKNSRGEGVRGVDWCLQWCEFSCVKGGFEVGEGS